MVTASSFNLGTSGSFSVTIGAGGAQQGAWSFPSRVGHVHHNWSLIWDMHLRVVLFAHPFAFDKFQNLHLRLVLFFLIAIIIYLYIFSSGIADNLSGNPGSDSWFAGFVAKGGGGGTIQQFYLRSNYSYLGIGWSGTTTYSVGG